MKKLMDRHKVAERLDLSPDSLLDPRYRRRLGLPVVRIGRLLRFRVEDVEKLVARGAERLPVQSNASSD
jgi:hypothetical protein